MWVCQQNLGQCANSSMEYVAPVGLLGELNISHLVLTVIASSSCSGTHLKLIILAAIDNGRCPPCQLHHIWV